MSPLLQGLVTWWNNEHAITAKVIGAIPSDQSDYRPHDKSMTAGELAWHIAISEVGVVNFMLTGSFEGDGGERPEAPDTFQDIVAWSDTAHQDVVARVSALSDAELTETVDFFGQQLPRMAIINFLLAHEIHHRGQLSVYIRLAGGKAPAIYGGSADEPMQM